MRFVPYHLHHKHGLIISDYTWWHEHQSQIWAWMAAYLPRGTRHQQGMTVEFDSESDQLLFMLKWA
jgi:hypothetical protein